MSEIIRIRIARDAKTGRFIPRSQAKHRPALTVIETIRRWRRQFTGSKR